MKDMTKGRITSQLIRFSIPLILGNLFQLTYNAVDSIIVGRFTGAGVASHLVPVMGLKGVAYASMIGWGCMLFAEIPYYLWFKSRNELLQERDR